MATLVVVVAVIYNLLYKLSHIVEPFPFVQPLPFVISTPTQEGGAYLEAAMQLTQCKVLCTFTIPSVSISFFPPRPPPGGSLHFVTSG